MSIMEISSSGVSDREGLRGQNTGGYGGFRGHQGLRYHKDLHRGVFMIGLNRQVRRDDVLWQRHAWDMLGQRGLEGLMERYLHRYRHKVMWRWFVLLRPRHDLRPLWSSVRHHLWRSRQ